MLFMGVPSAQALVAAGPLDAIGIAGAARAMAPDAMRAELTGVGQFFRQVAPTVLHYKVCSTFDSAPHVGNIACAIQTLHPSVDNRWVPILGGQPSLADTARSAICLRRPGRVVPSTALTGTRRCTATQ